MYSVLKFYYENVVLSFFPFFLSAVRENLINPSIVRGNFVKFSESRLHQRKHLTHIKCAGNEGSC